MSDPVFDVLRTLEEPVPRGAGALALLHRPDFRRLYLAVAASELGDSLHYIALMWFALDAGGPLGVVAVRLADSIPSLLFGGHVAPRGGRLFDRHDRLCRGIDRERARARARAGAPEGTCQHARLGCISPATG